MNPITVTDIQTTPPPARPRLWGIAWQGVAGWVADLSVRPIAGRPNYITFTIPTDREIELRREREIEIDHLLVSVERGDKVFAEAAVQRIRQLDYAIAEEASK